MSDLHIGEITQGGRMVQVIMHIPTPSGNNNAGISWADAVVLKMGGADNITSRLGTISDTELASLKAGAIVEKWENIKFASTDLTPAQQLTEIRNAFKRIRDDLIQENQQALSYMGWEGSAI